MCLYRSHNIQRVGWSIKNSMNEETARNAGLNMTLLMCIRRLLTVNF